MILNKMRGAIGNIPEMMEFDREFHISIARAAHNNFLFSIMLNMPQSYVCSLSRGGRKYA